MNTSAFKNKIIKIISFNLEFFTKVLALGTAFIFRKNIANVTRRYFPEFANGVGKLLTDAKGFIKKFKGSGYLATGWHKYNEYETAAKNFVKDGFNTPTGMTFKSKMSGAWNWIKGIFLKKPPLPADDLSRMSSGL